MMSMTLQDHIDQLERLEQEMAEKGTGHKLYPLLAGMAGQARKYIKLMAEEGENV